ncbi:DUF5060 domain-containing protein [Telmatobacter bradus]|uniref:DUF5060 domain-containing protein n=1 Tax=Telmatobacter bradus TaxID=474953 RepID=UPI003B438E92
MNRRELIKWGTAATLAGAAVRGASAAVEKEKHGAVEQWSVFELQSQGPSGGNPFVDVSFGARFTLGHRNIEVNGFYDGNGQYKVRFSPDVPGPWSFETISSAKELSGRTGAFECVAAVKANRGPVQTAHQFHFQYADGSPYFPFGTTCYSLGFVGDPVESMTLEDMKQAGFNKVRLCLLPKSLGKRKAVAMPFVRIGPEPAEVPADGESEPASKRFDLTRLNPAYFAHFESCLTKLQQAGIEADIILFHPYDAHGFSAMDSATDDRYLRYAIARFSAYRNVWWSVANEYDLVKTKSMTDWDRFFRIIQENDPYSRLRSIHHSKVIYDHSKPWCTHASLQESDFEKSPARFAAWNKPIIYDEIMYEGNIARRWGNLSAEEMTHRFWRAIVYGSYATHGETFAETEGIPTWSDAGKLRGHSAERITFLRKVLESTGTTGLTTANDPYYLNAFNADKLYLWYFDFHCVGEYEFPLPEKTKFKAEVIDPWAMTRTPLEGVFSGKSKIALPGKPYHAVLFTKA